MTLIEEAQALMLHQFASSHRLHALLKALVRPFQEVLDSAESLRYGCYIDKAYGYSLDIIGNIVGQPRDAMSDEDYRPWIKVRILLNKNTGTPEDIFAILGILFGSKPKVSMEESKPNLVILTFYEYPRCPTKVLYSIIRSALPLSTASKFMRANPPASTAPAIRSLKKSSKVFQFDVTAFAGSYFADFHEEDKA